jgi:molybdenum cofactor synthesis domain-containing protein
MPTLHFAILITSDRSFKGERQDSTIQILTDKIIELGWQVQKSSIVPDEIEIISTRLIDWVDNEHIDIILTSGGTGFSSRDITPEATLKVMDRNAPGISEAIDRKSVV